MTPPIQISVIIPVYNKGPFVGRALASVIRQTRQPQEILVIDDGSTDDSCAVVERLQHPLIRLVRQPNGGPSAARNHGISLAKGNILALLDADDEWYPRWLERGLCVYEEASRIKPVGIVTSFLNRQKHPGLSHPSIPNAPWSWIDSFCRECTVTYPISSSSAIIPADVLKEVGLFDTRVRLKEDVDLWIRIGLKYSILRVNEVLALIHDDDPSSITKIPRPRDIPIDVESICRHFQCTVDEIPLEPEREYARHALYRFCLGMLKYRRFDLFDQYVGMSRFTWRQRMFMTMLRRAIPLLPERGS